LISDYADSSVASRRLRVKNRFHKGAVTVGQGSIVVPALMNCCTLCRR
jgi:hypothetical protein